MQPTKGAQKIDIELKRVMYILSKSRRKALLIELEKYNDHLRKLIGNVNSLEPMRRTRENALPGVFDQIRSQASGLHAAVCRALLCGCAPHATSILLPKTSKPNIQTTNRDNLPEHAKFNLYLPFKSGVWSNPNTPLASNECWRGIEVELVDSEETEDLSLRPLMSNDSRSSGGKLDFLRHRKVSFQSSLETRLSVVSTLPSNAEEISDLCTAVREHKGDNSLIGYLRGNDGNLHLVSHLQGWTPLLPGTERIVKLDSLLNHQEKTSFDPTSSQRNFPRHVRLSIALAMAETLLKFHPGPLLKQKWSKYDICFFCSKDDITQTDHPLLLISLDTKDASVGKSTTPGQGTPGNSRSTILSLGVLILELWFNTTIETHPLRQHFLGPDGRGTEFTNFNTAQKWQEQALEEGGVDLHNVTWRCIYCNFGAASQFLGDKGLQRAPYAEVVVALQRFLERFSGA